MLFSPIWLLQGWNERLPFVLTPSEEQTPNDRKCPVDLFSHSDTLVYVNSVNSLSLSLYLNLRWGGKGVRNNRCTRGKVEEKKENRP